MTRRMHRIAVTGANGFMGSHLVRRLLVDGREVLCLARSPFDAGNGARIRVTDYSPGDLAEALQGCDALVHLAGRRSVRGEDMELVAPFAETGLSLLDGLLRGALQAGLAKVVQASSIAVYSPRNARPYSEDERPIPASNYGLAKLFCEDYADWWSLRHDVPVAHLRIAACYGAGEKDTPALMKLAGEARAGKRLDIGAGGRHTIDEVYVDDVADAFVRALDTDGTGAFNIGSGQGVTVGEIARTANEVFANEGNLRIRPPDEGWTPTIDNHMRIERAGAGLGWRPRHSLAQGLAAMRDELARKGA